MGEISSAADVAVVILTYNEEVNLPQALSSIQGWAKEVFVVDSFSADGTEAVAKTAGGCVFKHEFEDYSKQRNWALQELPFTAEWILFLDADEWLPPELKDEISSMVASNPVENGFYLKWQMIWMGKWIRRGYYPTWILRLFRRGTGSCEARGVNEHLIVSGQLGYLSSDFVHEDRKPLVSWIRKHLAYAEREAAELVKGRSECEIQADLFGSQAERKRWLRYRVYNRLPPLVRPLLYFVYRYFFRAGFLDGREALIFHFLQGLWFPLLVDARYIEMQRASSEARSGRKS
ncbi:MAG: glycosyltransferase family 2 protein [Bryobacterales bacterium]|nr:glycosyltransferase family 2 protein [Bryobacterales bacterium]